MQSPRWGNEGRQHCIHLWVPCAVFPMVWDEGQNTAMYRPSYGEKKPDIEYKICIRPDCRKVLT